MWKPITEDEFRALLESQEKDLSEEERQAFQEFRVPLRTATIVRNRETGNERVFVVASCAHGVLYFDDVEYGFNMSATDDCGMILRPGGSQFTLGEAIQTWLVSRHVN